VKNLLRARETRAQELHDCGFQNIESFIKQDHLKNPVPTGFVCVDNYEIEYIFNIVSFFKFRYSFLVTLILFFLISFNVGEFSTVRSAGTQHLPRSYSAPAVNNEVTEPIFKGNKKDRSFKWI
jgi:hypothetical protein